MQVSKSSELAAARPNAKKARMSGPESKEAIGERLRWTRLALGFQKQVDICRDIGDEGMAQAWNNWESGRDRIGLDNALMLCRRYRLSLDWIYTGNDGNLPASLARRIADIRASEKRPAKRA